MGLTATQQAAAERGIVIVGAGQAGGRAAEALRTHGFRGRITLIGDEVERPYERPSLSKEMLLDLTAETIAWLHEPDFYEAKGIELRLGIVVERIDRDARTVHLSDGTELGYGVLLLATGARARELPVPGGDMHCWYLRSIKDSRQLRTVLAPDMRLLVIGAGFIGLEVAAAAAALGCAVTIVEASGNPLGRTAPPPVQAYYRDLHEAHGVAMLFESAVLEIEPRESGYSVRISDGQVLEADIVVAGIGAVANVELALNAGLACNRGILVNAFGDTSDPWIFAAGDVAEQQGLVGGRSILLESWQNAQDQAIAIGRNLAGSAAPMPYGELPWFWSDQYGRNLQMYGLAEPGMEIVERHTQDGKLWIGLRDERIIYAAGVDNSRQLRALRELMKLNAAVSADTLANEQTDIMAVLRSARATGGRRVDAA